MPALDPPKKSRGRPAVESDEVHVRIQRPLLDLLDHWRDTALGQPNRPEAIRRLMEQASAMTDTVTNTLIFETLKAMQAKLSDIAGDVHDVKADVRGIKGHMAAFMQSELAQDSALAAIQARIERIERRLEING